MLVMALPYLEPLLDWYSANARDLPWRAPAASPWSVLVSEVMLQQTPVSRVLPAHQAWLARWPSPAALAADPPAAAVRQWGRLGYPRRALRLHETASIVARQHDGQVPSSRDELLTLPGIGAYTAAAVRGTRPKAPPRPGQAGARPRVPRPPAIRGRIPPSRIPAPRRPHSGRPLVSRRHGTRRPDLHGGSPEMRRLPGRTTMRLARERSA